MRNNFSAGKTIIVTALTLALCLLAGCIPAKESKGEDAKTLAAARPILTAYAESLPGDYKLTEITNVSGAKEGESVYTGLYSTHVVHGRLESGDAYVNAYVLTDTGEIWTDYDLFDLNEQVGRKLEPYFTRYGYDGDYAVRGVGSVTSVTSENIPDKKEGSIRTVATLENMIPADLMGETIEERADEFLQQAPITAFTVYYVADGISPITPMVIGDFLQDTGNYIPSEGLWESDIDSYELIGLTREGYDAFLVNGEIPVGERFSGNPGTTLYHDKVSGEMTYESETFAVSEQDEFVVRYRSVYTTGDASNFGCDEIKELECPVLFDGNTLRPNLREDGCYAELYFKGKPSFTKASLAELSEDKDEDEVRDMDFFEIGDGYFSVSDSEVDISWKNPYTFKSFQTVSFE